MIPSIGRLRWAAGFGCALLLLLAPPAGADNFTESHGCAVNGVRPPLPGSGPGLEQEVHGPWADFFGRSRGSVESQLVEWEVPMSGGRKVLVHARSLPAFEQVSANLAAAEAAGNYYDVSVAFGKSWRQATGGRRYSQHAFGNAVDINPPANPYIPYANPGSFTDMPLWYVEAWQAAGFCWGGDWVSIKDAMHFSWRGPAATPGYGPIPPPQPPVTALAPFNRVALSSTLAFEPAAAWQLGLADRNRDGAADIYGYRWMEDGTVRVEVAGAVGGFQTVGIRADVAVDGGPATHKLLMADYDGDSRLDLWVLDQSTGEVVVHADGIFPPDEDVDLFEAEAGRFTIDMSDVSQLLTGDYDRDGRHDLFVLRSDRTLTILGAADDYASVLLTTDVGVNPELERLGLGDFDLDGIPDLYVFEGSGRLRLGTFDYGAGPLELAMSAAAQPGVRLLGDYDGDGRRDVYAFDGDLNLKIYLGGARSAEEDLTYWFTGSGLDPWDAGPECTGPFPCDQIGFVTSAGEFNLKQNLGWEPDGHYFYYGVPGDVPLVGDWDCDGTATPGMFRPSNGFVYLSNSNETKLADIEFFYGIEGDIPLAGDWNGDGCDTLATYRQGQVFIRNQLGTGNADYSFFFGVPGDRPFVGDFDGDGIDSLGLYRAVTGFAYFRNVLNTGFADEEFFYGAPGDSIVAGDWDGDGDDSVAIFRPADGRWYLSLDNAQGPADHIVAWGPNRAVMTVAGFFGELDG